MSCVCVVFFGLLSLTCKRRCMLNAADAAFTVLGDLWVLSTVDLKWTEVEAGTPAPSARYGHAMTVVGQQIFLYGGQGSGYGE